MNITELINELKTIRMEHGDLPILVSSDAEGNYLRPLVDVGLEAVDEDGETPWDDDIPTTDMVVLWP